MKRAIVLLVVLAACSGSAGTDQAGETTTTSLSPEAAFRSDITAGLAGVDATTLDALVEYAGAECAVIDAATQIADGDAENDTPESDAVITAEAIMNMIGLAWGPDGLAGRGFGPDEIAVVMRAAAENFCPQHSAAVDTYIAART